MATTLAEDKIMTVIRRLQGLYLVLSCVGLLVIMGLVLGWSDRPLRDGLEATIRFLI